MSFAKCGIRPHRIITGRRVPRSLSRTTHSMFSVGGRFNRGGKFGGAKMSSSFSRLRIWENSLLSRTRPHMLFTWLTENMASLPMKRFIIPRCCKV
jgi:hypothetical protein